MGLKFSFIIKSALILIPISVFAQDNVLVDLSEFYAQDVNVAGFSLTSSQEIKIETAALTPHRSNYPVSDAWILNSDSRDVVWLLEDADDTDSDDDITFYDDAISLEPGNYEVYYSTYFKHKNGYWERDDYRGNGFFSRLFRGFSDDNEDDWYIRRRDYKKLFIKISGSGTAADGKKEHILLKNIKNNSWNLYYTSYSNSGT